MATAETLKLPPQKATRPIEEGEIEAITDWLRGGRLPPTYIGVVNGRTFTINNKRDQIPNES